MHRRTNENARVFNEMELSMDPIVKDVLRITYVYGATVTEEVWHVFSCLEHFIRDRTYTPES